MRWLPCTDHDFSGMTPSPRSGHSSVLMNGDRLVIFGGLADTLFLNDLTCLDTANNTWLQPECSGSSGDASASPSPRAFHATAAINCNMFLFGGRGEGGRLGDFWMLDADNWQWTELSAYGEQPPGREFASMVAVGNRRLALYGGWDGTKWLSDLYILDTMSLEWRQLAVTGVVPTPRCGQSATMVEKRLLMYGGRGSGGAISGELWALKGLFEGENEAGWTNLKLPGSSPGARCGHSCTSFGTQLIVFGGQSVSGWITKQEVYHNDTVILDRASVQWKKPDVEGSLPPPRAYHSATRVGKRILVIGGSDGKAPLGDAWWLVSQDDPLAKRAVEIESQTREAELAASAVPPPMPTPPVAPAVATPLVAPKARDSEKAATGNLEEDEKENGFPMAELRVKLGIPETPNRKATPGSTASSRSNGLDDPELIHFGLRRTESSDKGKFTAKEAVNAARAHLSNVDPNDIRMCELPILLADYHRLVRNIQQSCSIEELSNELKNKRHRFFHMQNAQEVQLKDIPGLLAEYRELVSRLEAM